MLGISVALSFTAVIYVRILIALVAIMAFSAISIAITVIAPMFASETEETHEH